MSIETGPRRYPHESIPVPLIRDKRLSFRARGIAIRLLSNAPGFRMTAEDLVLIGLAIAAWLFWKWFNSGLDGIPDPVHPVIQRVVVVHEYPHSRIDQS